MCGIWALVTNDSNGGSSSSSLSSSSSSSDVTQRPTPFEHEQFMRIVGRGPDLTVCREVSPGVHLGFHRLAIVIPGEVPSNQPIEAATLSVVCNGEIYNHVALKDEYPMAELQNGSDCAAILSTFAKTRDLAKTCASLDGVFAFILVDSAARQVHLGRDPIGVRPLFYGYSEGGDLFVGSELKSVEQLCERVYFFPPGSCATLSIGNFKKTPLQPVRYFTVPSVADRFVSESHAQRLIREQLLRSVEKRLMGNRRFGCLLSGGLDSSLISAISTKFMREAGGPPPVAFSVGFHDSPDLENARRVAEFLNIPHEVLVITPEQCIDIVPEVVYAMETFDPLLIRCGIAHFLLCRHISQMSDVVVLLSGEGADELFGSYAYMQRAPNALHLHKEMLRRLEHLHQYDVLRCDRATACHGLEIRVPFLDKAFVDLVARLPPTYKIGAPRIEKHLLRAAFAGWLPEQVLWRGKEGFAEALGRTDLGDVIGTHVDRLVSDAEFAMGALRFPHSTPDTKEEYWYRALFEQAFEPAEKMLPLVHTKIYRTAAWQATEEKENFDRSVAAVRAQLGEKQHQELMRLRRRSTGGLSGVA